VSPDGAAVFVTGQSPGSVTANDYATIAYDAATGAKLWVRRYNGPTNGEDGATALAVSPDGAAVFVTGYSAGSETSLDYATAAYDASTGAKLWSSRYNGPANGIDFPIALAVSPDGAAVFVTGASERPGGVYSYDYATVAYSAR
jgi:outer membrane protein assembly factor BamB